MERTPPSPVAVPREAAPRALAEAASKPPAIPRPSKASEPIQITTIDVGAVEVGKGIEMEQTVIATPIEVATGELANMFPEPLVMPQVDMSSLAPAADQALISMPEPPPMPVIDWADVAPPMPEVPTIEDIPIRREGD